ncbi:MAG TPA: DUF3570 domain-containing protein [Polyangiaceae bacterium]|jgi:hypothetical protein|nr:DUF3570 domain-containing protein [Polyangiaceae bacterium]
MQLRCVAAACAAVTLSIASPSAAAGPSPEGRVATEVAGYADTDHVAVLTPSISGHVEDPAAGWSVDGSYLVDVISAASVDIVSTASPRWTEVRQAGDATASYKPKDFGVTASGSVSSEPDYFAYAAGGAITQDLDDRNLTLLLGYGYGHDTIGRTGTPFSVYSHSFDHHTIDAGFTRLLDRRTVLALTADLRLENGDSSKPYRYIPLFSVQIAPSVPAGATVQEVSRLRLPETVIERLPLSRQRFGLTARLAHRRPRATTRIESALYGDTWGLFAFTADGRELFDLAPRWSVGPHVRYYVQSAVSFWHAAYVGTAFAVPAFRTGDRELGPLMNLTGGGTARWEIGPAETPERYVLGLAFDATYTRFFDDLYIRRRLSTLGALTAEAAW